MKTEITPVAGHPSASSTEGGRRVGGRPKGSKTRVPMPPAPPGSVVGYIRVGRGERRPTLKKQTEKIREHCAANGLSLVALHVDDGAPSTSMDRPALQAALAAVRLREAAALLVYSVDRLTTNTNHMAVLLDTDFARDGARLMSACEDIDNRSASGRLGLNLATAVAQCNREMTPTGTPPTPR